MSLLEVKDLRVHFLDAAPDRFAVDGISFSLEQGGIFGLVGESGSGKTVTAMCVSGLLPREKAEFSGSILLDGTEIFDCSEKQLESVLGRELTVVFQEPMTSFNPVLRIGKQVEEGLRIHEKQLSKEERRRRSLEAMRRSGLSDPEEVYRKYPHELSGGMLQRAMIASAIVTRPKLLIADEPTTALDVTIQAQILDLLQGLKDKLNSSIMLITHDLGVVAGMADYVVVMYAGRVVEKGTADDIFHHPVHPYTIGLMASKPVVGKKVDKLYNIPGSVPNPVDMPNYCYFRDRCEMHCERCSGLYPPEIKISDTHFVSCYRYYDEGEIVSYPKSVNVEEL